MLFSSVERLTGKETALSSHVQQQWKAYHLLCTQAETGRKTERARSRTTHVQRPQPHFQTKQGNAQATRNTAGAHAPTVCTLAIRTQHSRATRISLYSPKNHSRWKRESSLAHKQAIQCSGGCHPQHQLVTVRCRDRTGKSTQAGVP